MRSPSGPALLTVFIAAALALCMTGCSADYVSLVPYQGGLYFFNCTKGTVGQYEIRNLLGLVVKSGTFDPASHNCYDVEDDVWDGIDPNTHGPLAKPGNPLPRTTPATPAKLPLQYILDVSATNAVQILDPVSVTAVEVDLPSGSTYPVSMAMMPDKSKIWVLQYGVPANSQGVATQAPQISIMDVASQKFTGSFALPASISPNSVRFTPDGTTAYISNDASGFLGVSGTASKGTVLAVDVASQTVTSTIAVPKGAGQLIMSPDGLIVYTIFNNNGSTSALTAIDATTQTVGASVPLLSGAIKGFINPTGTRLYIDTPLNIVVYDTATLQQIAAIPTVGFSMRNNFAAFSPDGQTATFCNCGFGMYYTVDLRTNKVINSFQTENLGHGFMFSTAQ